MAREQNDIEEVHELVGSYALDALEPDEAREFETHLDSCPRCRAELRDHRDTASYLAHAGAPAPDGVWERIAAQLEEEPPDVARILPLLRPKQSIARRVVWAAAAAAVIGLGAGAFVQSEVGTKGSGSLEALAAAAVHEPGARVGTLREAEVVVTRDGRGYITNLDLPPLDAGHTYQLWGVPSGGEAVSLGLLGRAPRTASFTADVRLSAIAVTVERKGGVPKATTSPTLVSLHRA